MPKLPATRQKNMLRHSYTSVAPDMHGMTKADELLRQMRVGLGYDPLVELVEIAQSTDNEAIRVTIAKELMQYVHPKQRSKEVSQDKAEVFDIQIITDETLNLMLPEGDTD